MVILTRSKPTPAEMKKTHITTIIEKVMTYMLVCAVAVLVGMICGGSERRLKRSTKLKIFREWESGQRCTSEYTSNIFRK